MNEDNIPIAAGPGQIIMYDGISWVISSDPVRNISLQTIMDLEDPNVQEGIIHILKGSFTEPQMIEKFINQLSPTEELRQLRMTIWQMIR